MSENGKIFDLEERTYLFAVAVRRELRLIAKSSLINNDITQLIRSSGSVGANYIEANESLSKKDFLMRVKICRKEVKESIYWLKIIQKTLDDDDLFSNLLIEAHELMKIFGAIVTKSQ